jgi:tetratricopeptide (TPR) repeat protein
MIDDIDTGNFNKLFAKAVNYYTTYDYKSALKLVDELLKINKKNIECRNLKACILLESWDGSESTKRQIKEAISYFDVLIEEDSTNKWNYLGNQGNAFNKLANVKLKINAGKLDEEAIENLEKAKDFYQDSLKLNKNQPEIWINKGNMLDYLGRYLEAIECYDMAILKDERHYNAWGNRGISFLRLSELINHEVDKRLLTYNGMTYIGIELMLNPDFQIDFPLKEKIENHIKKNEIKIDLKETLKNQLPKKKVCIGNDFNLYQEINQTFKEFYNNFCENEGYFLNVHFDCNNCGRSSLDLLQFSIISNIDDYKTPYHFMKNLHNIMDDYKTARFLLALSQYRHPDFLFLDTQRYEPDYSLNYTVNVELLKEAFIKTLNICDKIAFFLKDYKNLFRHDGKNIDDSVISFFNGNNIFSQTKIVENEDYQIDLVALNSIRKDLQNGEFRRMLNIRNYLVHRHFVLHDIIDVENLTYPYDENDESLEDLHYHEDVTEFYNLNKKALRLVRNMIFSLYFFVNQEEQKKMNNTSKVMPLYWNYNLSDT